MYSSQLSSANSQVSLAVRPEFELQACNARCRTRYLILQKSQYLQPENGDIMTCNCSERLQVLPVYHVFSFLLDQVISFFLATVPPLFLAHLPLGLGLDTWLRTANQGTCFLCLQWQVTCMCSKLEQWLLLMLLENQYTLFTNRVKWIECKPRVMGAYFGYPVRKPSWEWKQQREEQSQNKQTKLKWRKPLSQRYDLCCWLQLCPKLSSALDFLIV